MLSYLFPNRLNPIIHIVFSLRNGGKENFLIDLMNKQTELGQNVFLIILNNAIDPILLSRLNKGINVKVLNRHPEQKWNLLWFLKLYWTLLITPFKKIHCHDTSLSKILFIISKDKLSVTLHSVGRVNYMAPFTAISSISDGESKFLNSYGKIFAISNSVKNVLDYSNAKRCIVIYNGICSKQIKLKTNYNKKDIKIVQVGNLYHNIKGQDILINAFYLLKTHYYLDNISLIFIGEGASRNYLELLVNKYSIQDYVSFVGSKDRKSIYNELCDYDIFVQPSRTEGFGLSVVEAMCAGLPVIASEVEGLIEVTKNGIHGRLFEINNHEDLAKKIFMLIEYYNTNKMHNEVIRARDFAFKNFDIRITSKKYINNY